MKRWQLASSILVASCYLAIASSLNGASLAQQSQYQANPSLQPDNDPLDMNAIPPGKAPASVITENTVSQSGLTVPSLWWVRDQLAAKNPFDAKLIETWLAYPGAIERPGRIDFVVDSQRWSFLDYLHRYEFLNQFGETARVYGYNIRVFDSRARLLGAYTCDFSTASLQTGQDVAAFTQASELNQPIAQSVVSTIPSVGSMPCYVELDFAGKGSLEGGSTDLFGAP